MKKILSIVVFGLMLQSAVIYGQSPIIEWYKLYNGTSGFCVEQTSDSGYIIVGEIWRGAGLQDLHLIKTNPIGDTIWTRCYEGSNINSNGYSVHQGFDGGFIATGVYYDLTYYVDLLYIVKTDANGDLLWSRTFKGASQTWGNAGFSITQVPDSGFVAAGYSQLWGLGDNVFLVKVTNDGDTSWVHNYGGNQWERGYSAIPTSDSGLVVAGSIRPASTLDYWDNVWFMKTNAAGNTQWIKTFNWPYVDVARSIQQTPDGGYLATGYTNSFGAGDYDYFLLKLNSVGDSLWFKTYGTNHSGRCYSVQSLSDGNYLLAGTEHIMPINHPRIVLVKVNPLGDTLWTKIFLGDGGQPVSGYCVDETFDNGYIVTGQFGTTYLVKLLEEPINVEDNQYGSTNFDYMLFENYPNPFNPSTVIRYQLPVSSDVTLKIFDILGNEIATLVNEEKKAGNYSLEFDASSLSSGIYFYQIRAGEFIQTKKMILLR